MYFALPQVDRLTAKKDQCGLLNSLEGPTQGIYDFSFMLKSRNGRLLLVVREVPQDKATPFLARYLSSPACCMAQEVSALLRVVRRRSLCPQTTSLLLFFDRRRSLTAYQTPSIGTACCPFGPFSTPARARHLLAAGALERIPPCRAKTTANVFQAALPAVG